MFDSTGFKFVFDLVQHCLHCNHLSFTSARPHRQQEIAEGSRLHEILLLEASKDNTDLA